MRIVIEARALSHSASGVRTYTYQLIRHLLAEATSDHYQLLFDSNRPAGEIFANVPAKLVPRYGALVPLWLQWQVPRALHEMKADLIHFTKADVPRRKVAPTVVTIFDIIPLLFPESQTLTRRWYWPRALRRAALLSDHIVTISESARRDICERFDRAASDVTVTPPAVDLAHFKPVPGRVGKPFILFVGTRDKRKNIGGLLRAFARITKEIPHRLIIVGRSALKPDGAEAEARRLSLGDRVEFRGAVSYRALPQLYSDAALFVWPSIYEGWGFPPQEAMACGTPVIVSDGGAIPEVVGNAGSIIPFSTAHLAGRLRDEEFETRLADEMVVVLNDEQQRRAMQQRGLAQVRQFSWAELARKTAQVYKKTAARSYGIMT
jgi:glycosyltransferase involved in cell wall biosynthesis